MAANLATALLEHGRIQTTEAKARLARSVAERAITLGKDGSLHARRQAISLLRNKPVSYRLFNEIAPVFQDVSGGYTRVIKLGPRPGDAAPMVLLELSREVPGAAASAE
jgi:large subunit ribosomal protein L17